MSMSGMSGTLARPAGPFPRGAVDRVNARRLAGAAIGAVVMHFVLLVARPGVLASSYVAPSAPPVMAVRLLRAPATATPVPSAAEATPAPVSAEMPAAITAQVAPTPVKAPAAAPLEARTPARAGADGPATRTDGAAASPAAAAVEPKGTETPLAAAPDYALGVRLDPGPRPLDDIEPEYPDPVHLREGVVVLRILISETGHVDDVAVVRAEPRGVFEQAALEAFAKARFAPGLAAGTPVKSQMTVEVQFMPLNRGGRVSGRTY
jgi:periplasmic protein TonB